jgi:hypothetical protein
VVSVPSGSSVWGSGEDDANWARWSDGDDQSGAMSTWWFLSGISLGPWDTLLDSSTTIREESTDFDFQSLLLGGLGVVSWRSGLLRS